MIVEDDEIAHPPNCHRPATGPTPARSVTTAASTADALQSLHRLPTASTYILSDIGLPGEDGYSLIRRARLAGATLPALALTAYTRPQDHARATAAGYQTHLAKPVEPAALLAAVATLAAG